MYKLGVWPQRRGQSPGQPPEDTIWFPETSDWDAAQVFTISGAGELRQVDFDLR